MQGFAAVAAGEALLWVAPLFAVLAAVLFVGGARRRDAEHAVGKLSRETVRRDVTASPHRLRRRQPQREAARTEASPSAHLEPTAVAATPERWTPPDPERLDVTRRRFLNRAVVSVSGFGLGAFAFASIGFLWPSRTGGFGSNIRVGELGDIRAKIAEGRGFAYYPEGRMWITAYPAEALDKAQGVYDAAVLAGMQQGIVALYQKCPHLGCRVPQCTTSQWFECPCHGSQYNQAGEKKGGPAPRGMDRFPVTVTGETVTVDTGVIVQGPPIGTNTTGQEAEGPHCISDAGEH